MPADPERPGEPAFLATYDLLDHPVTAVTVDVACCTIREGRLAVLLVRRGAHPFLGCWALPGGFSRADETLSTSAHRELGDETGVRVAHLEQLGTYGDPGRDPRGPIVSVTYLAFGPNLANPVAGDDASATLFWTITDLDLDSEEATATIDLAFDHRRILTDAVERIRAKLEYTTLATAFCREVFTIAELRGVYEAAWGGPIHPGNFRRKVISTPGFVIRAGMATSSGPGRPAELFRRGPATRMNPPLLRPDAAS